MNGANEPDRNKSGDEFKPDGPQETVAPHPHAVENGVIRHLSVSQIKTFDDCERKWFWNKVKHYPTRTSKGQRTGTEGHAQVEHYLKTGADVLGTYAAEGKWMLPAPGADLLVEEPLGEHKYAPSVLTAAGIPLVGAIDLMNPREINTRGLLGIDDHKFSKDPGNPKWRTTPEQLITTTHGHGIQMVGYGRWAWLSGAKAWGVEQFKLRHNYFATGGSRATRAANCHPVEIVVKAHAFDAEWSRVEYLAERMTEVARAEDADGAVANWKQCDKYGGCDFREQCRAFEFSKGRAPPSVNPLDLLLGKTTATPAEPKRGNDMGSLLDRLKTNAAAPAAPAAVPQPEASVPAPVEAPKCGDCGSALTDENTSARNGVTKHIGCQKPAPAVEHVEIMPGVTEARPIDGTGAMNVAQSLALAAAHGIDLHAKVETPPAAKRTRRSKAEMEAIRGASTEEELRAASRSGPLTESQAEQVVAAFERAITAPSATRIYVGCVPNGPFESLAMYLAGVIAALEKEHGVMDLRVPPRADHLLGFGRWKGVLAAAIKSSPPPPGTYALLGTSGSELMQVAVETLELMAEPGAFVRAVQ